MHMFIVGLLVALVLSLLQWQRIKCRPDVAFDVTFVFHTWPKFTTLGRYYDEPVSALHLIPTTIAGLATDP
jgi:hypothetical protein